MSKYTKYALWLAKAIVAVAAMTSIALYFKTFDGVYLARSGAEVAMLLVLFVDDEMLKLKRRIKIIESKQRGFVSFMNVTYSEQLDCKKRVDNLIKTLNGDEQ